MKSKSVTIFLDMSSGNTTSEKSKSSSDFTVGNPAPLTILALLFPSRLIGSSRKSASRKASAEGVAEDRHCSTAAFEK